MSARTGTQKSTFHSKKLDEYFFSKANQKIKSVKKQGKLVINLGIGQPDLSPPTQVMSCLSQQVLDACNYHYPGYVATPELRHAIATWYQNYYSTTIDPNTQLLVTSGAKEAITMVSLALANSQTPTRTIVLYPNPGYDAYRRATIIAGGKAIAYDLTRENNYLPDLDQLTSLIKKYRTQTQNIKSKIILWVNYPHNPTGAVVNNEQLIKIISWAKSKKVIIVSDQPYGLTIFEKKASPSILQLSDKNDAVIEVNSVSKTYNLPGLRIGWVAGNEYLVQTIQKTYGNTQSGIFLPTQKAAIKALRTDTHWIAQNNQILKNRIPLTLELSHTLNLTAKKPKAGLYIWASLPPDTKYTSEQFCFKLLEKTGVFFAPGTAFGSKGEGFIRISLTQPKTVIKQAIQQISKA